MKNLFKLAIVFFLTVCYTDCNAQQLRISPNNFGGENYYLNGRLVLQSRPNYFGGKTFNNGTGRQVTQTYHFKNEIKSTNNVPYFLRNAPTRNSFQNSTRNRQSISNRR